MKKLCRCLFFLLAAGFISLELPAQQFAEGRYMTVVAPPGLKLRTDTTLQSNTIKVLPFGARVEILDHAASGITMIDSIFGFWKKVHHAGATGYMFGAYLSPGRIVPPDDENWDFRVLYNHNCEIDLDFDPQMHWYAMQNSWSLDKTRLLPATVEISFDGTYEILGYSFRTREQGRNFDWLFGTRKPLPTGEITRYRISDSESGEDLTFKSGHFLHATSGKMRVGELIVGVTDLEKVKPDADREMHYFAGQGMRKIVVEWRGRTQVFDPANFVDRQFLSYCDNPAVNWAGDLDSDGIPDLMIAFDSEAAHWGVALYFLSSYARPGEILHLMRVEKLHDCC